MRRVAGGGGSADAAQHHVNNGTVTNNGVLDLTGGDTIQSGVFSNTGTTDVSGTGNAIDNETSFTNSNLLEVLAGGALTLSGDTVTNASGTIKVDAAASPAAAGQLTLLNTTVNNGTVTNNGVLDLTGGDTIQSGVFSNTGTTDVSGTGNAIDNETSFTNSNLLEVLAGGALTLSGDTVTNARGTIKVDAAASPAAAAQLTLLNTTVNNGTVTNNGVLDLTGGDTIQSGVFSNTGTTDVSGTGNAIDNETSFTNSNLLEVLAGGALTLSGDTVTNASGTIKVDAAASPAAAGQLTLLNTTVNNGTVTNNGVLDLTGGDTIQSGVFSNTGTTDVSGTGNAIDNETSFTNSNLLERAGSAGPVSVSSASVSSAPASPASGGFAAARAARAAARSTWSSAAPGPTPSTRPAITTRSATSIALMADCPGAGRAVAGAGPGCPQAGGGTAGPCGAPRPGR